MPTKTFTQRDLAKLAGVSYPTVNRALSGSDRVTPKMRKHIMEVADSVGYRKNMSAASLVTRKTYAIGLVSKQMSHSYWGDVFRSLEHAARRQGYHVVVCHRDSERDATSSSEISFLLERQVDGLIVVPNPVREDLSIFNTVASVGTPLLFLDEMVPGAPGHYIGSAAREGAREMCDYLLSLGHRRILHIMGQGNSYAAKCRRDGYRDAMRSAGVPVADDMVIEADGWDYEDANTAISQILAMSPMPTAIFAGNDPLAIQLSIGLRKAGVSIPDEVSLAGFSGMEEGTFLTPALTTVDQPSIELGEKAIDTMMRMIQGEEGVPVSTELPTKLNLRESCAPPPKSNATDRR